MAVHAGQKTFRNKCIERNPHNYSEIIGNEDCYYLNVWTPTIKASATLPVIVWIHGGNLEFSSGNWPTYSKKTQLVNSTKVFYISMHNRLHAFGFMALDILSEPLMEPLGIIGLWISNWH